MKDKSILEMYLEDIKSITPVEEAEMDKLLKALLKGDVGAKKRLIEGHLMYAVGLVQSYSGQGQDIGDLISETHLALTMAVNEYTGGDLKSQIKEKTEKRLKEVIEKERQAKNTSRELAQRINDLMEASNALAKEYGREATLKELSERLLIPHEEVEEILKISLKAMSLDENKFN